MPVIFKRVDYLISFIIPELRVITGSCSESSLLIFDGVSFVSLSDFHFRLFTYPNSIILGQTKLSKGFLLKVQIPESIKIIGVM